MLESVRRLSGKPADQPTWAAVGQLCCRTGDNGNPIAPECWDFFARLWIEPYRLIVPQWTYAAELEGRLAGYLTGCPNTRDFNRAKRRRVTLPLLAAVAVGRYRGVPATKAFVRQALGLSLAVEKYFSRSLQDRIPALYPAHLHINVEAEYRRLGLGRRLLEGYCGDLKAAGVSGVHLFCGADPVPFYLRLGFEKLERVEVGKVAVFALGLRS